MEIGRFEFYPNGDMSQTPTVLGLNINRRHGTTFINLLSLDENEGQSFSKNIWSIVRKIAEDILMGEKIDNVNWTFSSGRSATALKFSTFDGQPFKIDISNEVVFWADEHERGTSIEFYQKNVIGNKVMGNHNLPSFLPEGVTGEGYTRTSASKTVFCIPCNHPEAKDGVFHCKPSFFGAQHMKDDYDFVMVNTKKFIEELKKGDYGWIVEEARAEMEKDSAKGHGTDSWLKHTSIEHPRDMGFWVYREDGGLSLEAGRFELIQIVQDLNLPYFPVAVRKSEGAALREKVGYELATSRHMGQMYEIY